MNETVAQDPFSPFRMPIVYKVVGSEWVNANGEVTIVGLRGMIQQGDKPAVAADNQAAPTHRFDLGDGHLVELARRAPHGVVVTEMVPNPTRSQLSPDAHVPGEKRVFHKETLAIGYLNRHVKAALSGGPTG